MSTRQHPVHEQMGHVAGSVRVPLQIRQDPPPRELHCPKVKSDNNFVNIFQGEQLFSATKIYQAAGACVARHGACLHLQVSRFSSSAENYDMQLKEHVKV